MASYSVIGCPYKDAIGEYVRESPTLFVHSINEAYRLYREGKSLWVLSMNGKVCCNIKGVSDIPPPSGWYYWRSAAAAFTPTVKMEVQPMKSRPGSAKPPVPAPAPPAPPAPTPNTAPKIEPEPDVTPPPPARVLPPRQPSTVLPPPKTMELNDFEPPTEGWRKRESRGTIYNTVDYVNDTNGAVQKTVPDALVRAEKLENCVYSYNLRANNTEGKIEVFAPARFALERKRPVAQKGYYPTFEEYSVFWAHSVRVIEEEIKAVNAKIFKIREDSEKFPDERRALNAEINRLDKQLQEIKSRERTAQQRSDGLLSRVGKSHIKRDWQQTRVGSNFPAGEDYRSMFLERFLDFESFACDAVNCLDDLECKDSAGVLVSEIITPVFNAAMGEIARRLAEKRAILKKEFNTVVPEGGEDNIVKLFWYSTQQTQMLREVQALSEEWVLEMTQKLGGRVPVLLAEMERQAAAGSIANEETAIRINKLLGFLLELQTVAELSDPRCFLQPAPGSRVSYKEGYCMEILSPGTKKFGRIQEGDQVEVVLCGLYFEDSSNAFATVKPVVPCLVRRLVKT